MILSNSSKFTLYILFEPTRAHVYSKSFCNNKLFFHLSSLEKPWRSWVFLPTSLPKSLSEVSPQVFPITFPSYQPFHATRFSPSPNYCRSHKRVVGGRDYAKIPLSNDEEKHGDTHMVMNTTRNKTRKKML